MTWIGGHAEVLVLTVVLCTFIFLSSLKVSLLFSDIDRKTCVGSISYELMFYIPNKIEVVLPKFSFTSLPRRIDVSAY